METRGYRVAIIGAAGVVGQHVLKVLEKRHFPISELRLLATEKSAGTLMRFGDTDITVEETTDDRLEGLDIVFLAAGTSASRHWAPISVERGAVVIDKSNAFRADPEVPLVVPEVNGEDIAHHQGIVASPNCSTIQLVMVLKPILDHAGIERVVVSTYQSVSGTGRDAMDELEAQSRNVLEGAKVRSEVYPRQIAFNLLPHIDDFVEDDYTREEMKLVHESRRILGRPALAISSTTVRVPVFVSHSEAVLVELGRRATPGEIREWLAAFPGVAVIDDPARAEYPTPAEAAGSDQVFVGRIRRDLSSERGIWLWVVSDNLRKGAATNAVQIAEWLHHQGGLRQ